MTTNFTIVRFMMACVFLKEENLYMIWPRNIICIMLWGQMNDLCAWLMFPISLIIRNEYCGSLERSCVSQPSLYLQCSPISYERHHPGRRQWNTALSVDSGHFQTAY